MDDIFKNFREQVDAVLDSNWPSRCPNYEQGTEIDGLYPIPIFGADIGSSVLEGFAGSSTFGSEVGGQSVKQLHSSNPNSKQHLAAQPVFDECFGSLKCFLDDGLLGDLANMIEFQPSDFFEASGSDTSRLQSPQSPNEKPLSSPDGRSNADGKQLQSLRPLGGERRKAQLIGIKLMEHRLQAPRHKQLQQLVPIISGEGKTVLKSLALKSPQLLEETTPHLPRSARRDQLRAAAASVLLDSKATGWEASPVRLGWKEAHSTGVLRLSEEEALQAAKLLVRPVQELIRPRQLSVTPRPSNENKRRENNEHQPDVKKIIDNPSAATAFPPKKVDKTTNFNRAFISNSGVKLRVDQHPLLSAIEQSGLQVQEHEREASEEVLLARKLQELRFSETRRGPWASPPEPRKPLAEDGAARTTATRSQAAVGESHSSGHASQPHATKKATSDMHRMLALLDANRLGFIQPDSLVPLMFWLGITKKRSAALATLQVAFGPGDIPTAAIAVMGQYSEVQIRLVEGLRNLARRDSLEQLCEFMTDHNNLHLRHWFNSMPCDPAGCVDITQVQNLFARMEVTKDRQGLFRFLSFIAETPSPGNAKDPREKLASDQRKFSSDGFASLMCRCAVAWCLHRTISLLTNFGQAQERSVSLQQPPSNHDLSCRWIQLKRKILVSMLINERFWGRESRGVLSALQPPSVAGSDLANLSAEQWNSLFQRVRAQGLAAVLPDNSEEP